MKNEKKEFRQKTIVLPVVCSLLVISALLPMVPTVHALDSPTAWINPASQTVTPGANVCVEVRVNSAGQAVLGAQLTLAYPSSFTLTSFTYSNLLGTSVLQVGTPSPGATSINYGVTRQGSGNPAAAIDGFLATICFTAPSTAGTYTLDLGMTLVNGSFNTIPGLVVTDGTVTVTGGGAALAAQCGGPYTGYVGVGTPIQLTGSATGGTPPYSYAWDLDNDGSYDDSTLQNPTIHSTAPGTYTLRLRVTDNAAATATCTTTATFTNPPSGNPTAWINPASQTVTQGAIVCVDVYVNSAGQAVLGAQLTLTYPSSFTLTSFTYNNLLGTSVLQVGTPSPGATSINYGVTRQGSGNPAAVINGNLATICFTAPSTAGTYTLDLGMTLVNGSFNTIPGLVATDGTVTVSGGGAALAAQCHGPYSGYAGVPLSFTGSATGGTPPYSYAWDFDYTGTFTADSTLQNPTWTYTTTGTRTVALRVTDNVAATNMCTTTATITTQPTVTPPYALVYPATQTVGSTFCVDVRMNSNGQAVLGAQLTLTYPSSFTLTSFTYNNLLGTSVLQVGTPSPGATSINYGVTRQGSGNPAAAIDGTLATICFTVAPGTPAGTYPLDLGATLVDGSFHTITGVTVVDGTVTTLGPCSNDPDVNSDGRINVLDMILVGQHWGETGEAGWIPEDINCDGEINVLDMIVIGQNFTG